MIARNTFRLRLCVLLLILNLGFIWGNSLLPGSVSGAFSDWVKGIVQAIFPNFDSGSSGGGGFLLRKLAHFTEFCCLGLCLSWLFRMLFTVPICWYSLPLLSGFLAACADETIQRFIPGRGPSLRDVGIDTLGVTLGILVMTLIYTISKRK